MSVAAPPVPKQLMCRRGDELLSGDHRRPEADVSRGVRQAGEQPQRPEVRGTRTVRV